MRDSFVRCLSAVLAAAAIASCGATDVQVEPGREPGSIRFVFPDLTMVIGETRSVETIAEDVLGDPVPNVPVTYRSSDRTVAEISDEGLVTAVGEGVAELSATSIEDPNLSAVMQVTVVPPPPPPPVPGTPPQPASIVVSPDSASAQVGFGRQYTAKVFDQNQLAMPDTFDIQWTISDGDVADVSSSGFVTVISEGTADVTARVGAFSDVAKIVGIPGPPSPGQPPIFADGFESGNLSFTQNGAGWGGSDDTRVVTNEVARTGNSSLRYTFVGVPSGRDSSAEQRFWLGRRVTELWLEFWIYYPDGSEGFGPRFHQRRDSQGTNNNKFLRVWGEAYSERNKWGASTGPEGGGNASIYPEHAANERGLGLHGAPFHTDFLTDGSRGRWVQFRAHARLGPSADAETGMIRFWWDGELVIDARGLDMFDSTHNFWDQGYLLGWANSGFDETTFVWIDDVKIYDSDPGW